MKISSHLLFKCNEPPLSALAETQLAERWPSYAKYVDKQRAKMPQPMPGNQSREDRVKELVGQGMTTAEIARELHMSTQRVNNICRKAGLLSCWIVQRRSGTKWLYVCEARTRKEAINKYTEKMSVWQYERGNGKVRCIRDS